MNCNVSVQSILFDPGNFGLSSTASDGFWVPLEAIVWKNVCKYKVGKYEVHQNHIS